VEMLLRHEVLRILSEDGRVTGVQVRNKVTGEEHLLRTSLVISNIGPRATARLTGEAAGGAAGAAASGAAEAHPVQEAIGLKVHLLSNRSLIPHKGIMYCLDTERIAGMVQPTNSDRRLAPPGKHLLITHQVMRSDDVERERALALADLRSLFGPDFERECRVLTMSQYRGEWPVNRAQQGADAAPEMEVHGLYLVGDAVKPSGYLMVEGVAQSVNQLLDLLDDFEREKSAPQQSDHPFVPGISRPAPRAGTPQATHLPLKPRAARAFYWLLAPPPPARQEPYTAGSKPIP
jgi:phytoene dehydrogenase-like protein